MMACCLLCPSGLIAQVPVSRLFGTGDTLPGHGLPAEFAVQAVVAGDYTLFLAESWRGNEQIFGLYLHDGESVQRVFDSTQDAELPGNPSVGPGQLAHSWWDVGATGMVAFYVDGYGMVAWRDGVLKNIALNGQAASDLPGGEFYSFANPNVEGSHVVVYASLVDTVAGYLLSWSWEGSASRVIVPGVLPGSARLRNGSIFLFGAQEPSGPYGSWSNFSGGWAPFYTFDDPVPGAPGSSWNSMGGEQTPALTDDALAVFGNASDLITQGVFRLAPGAGEVVALDGAPDPVFGLTMDSFGYVVASGDRVGFQVDLEAEGQDPTFVMVQEPDRTFRSLAGEGEMLEGLPIGYLDMTWNALDGDRLVFEIARPGDFAIWEADLGPAPNPLEVPTLSSIGAGLLVATLALLGMAGVRTSRGR